MKNQKLRGPEPARIQAWTVEAPDTLLPFLLSHMAGKSRSHVKSLMERSQVLVTGKPVTQFNHTLTPGMVVSLAGPLALQLVKPPFPLLYEDDDILVIDKPAGLLTMASDNEKTATAYHLLTDYMRAKSKDGRVFIVHRLDRDTSGVVLFAKTEAVKRAFQDRWEELVKSRVYQAVVEGIPDEESGSVHSWLMETTTHLMYSVDHPGGKEALTRYEVLQASRHYALLDVQIDTGRKNQIRVHLQDLGHPVAGDKKYGAATNPIGRLALHAGTLALLNPLTEVETVFTAPIPKEFIRLCTPERGA